MFYAVAWGSDCTESIPTTAGNAAFTLLKHKGLTRLAFCNLKLLVRFTLGAVE